MVDIGLDRLRAGRGLGPIACHPVLIYRHVDGSATGCQGAEELNLSQTLAGSKGFGQCGTHTRCHCKFAMKADQRRNGHRVTPDTAYNNI